MMMMVESLVFVLFRLFVILSFCFFVSLSVCVFDSFFFVFVYLSFCHFVSFFICLFASLCLCLFALCVKCKGGKLYLLPTLDDHLAFLLAMAETDGNRNGDVQRWICRRDGDRDNGRDNFFISTISGCDLTQVGR